MGGWPLERLPPKAEAALGVWCFYVFVSLRHFYIDAVENPKYERIKHDAESVRLPQLYFCPADRGVGGRLKWYSFDCEFSYRENRTACPASVKRYRGREPGDFQDNDDGEAGGECVEFGTHSIGARAEWDVAWSDITLRAAFALPFSDRPANLLKEVELGYLCSDYAVGEGAHRTKTDAYYWRLLRVPYFEFLARSSVGAGVATRAFLLQDFYKGLHFESDNWMLYSAMPLRVDAETMPHRPLGGGALQDQMGVVHVVLTLDDWVKYDVQVESWLYPLLSLLGSWAGLAAFLYLAVGLGRSKNEGRTIAGAHRPQGRHWDEDDGGPDGSDEGERERLLDGL